MIVEELRIREKPSLTSDVTGAARAGDVVWTASSYPSLTTTTDDISWHQVSHAPGYENWPQLPETYDAGWVAAGSGDDRYLELMAPRCPGSEPDLVAVTSMTAWERLACFGDRPLTLVGTWGTRGCGGTAIGTFEPKWLAYLVACEWLRVGWPDGSILELRIPPDSGLASPTGGSITSVVGHFDDPAASACRHDGAGLVPDMDPDAFELYCREQFVVDSYDVIGTDPSFPP